MAKKIDWGFVGFISGLVIGTAVISLPFVALTIEFLAFKGTL